MQKTPTQGEPVLFDRSTPPHIVTLVLMTGVAALNMNMILPSLPSLAVHFDASYSVVQLAVSGYLALTAALQLIVGPMSDRFGRRPVLVVSFVVFLLASIGCALAPNIETFLAFRMTQTAIASALALSRAIVRDTVGPDEAASKIGYVTMGMSLAPMIGPMVGGFLDQAFGWQSVIWATFVFSLGVFALVWSDLGETNRHKSASFGAQFRAYPELALSRRFWGYSATAAFASGAFFAFLGGGPYVATEILGMSPAELGFYFGFIAFGYMLGNFLSGRFSSRLGMNRMMLSGAIVSTTGMGSAIVLFALGLAHPVSFFGPILFVGLGNGLTLPSANAGIVSVRPHLAGSASGLGNALMVGGGAGLSAIAGAMLGPGTGPWPLLILMTLSSGLAILTTLDVIRTARLRGALAR